jgi:hypothetical protein
MGFWSIPGGWIEFRPLTGRDERSVDGTGIFDALALIDRLNSLRPGTLIGKEQAVMLTAAARDRALAGIYTQNYGGLVLSSPHCTTCGERYDLSFSLQDLLKAYPVAPPPPDGVYQTADGLCFRLPTGTDELAVIGLPPDAARAELLKRCALSEDVSPGAVEAAMEAVAPLLNTEVQATCPECGAIQTAGFDIGTYLLRRLLSDRERLPGEIHTLAMAYGWSHDDILGLTRAERRRYIALIEATVRERRVRTVSGPRRRLG